MGIGDWGLGFGGLGFGGQTPHPEPQTQHTKPQIIYFQKVYKILN